MSDPRDAHQPSHTPNLQIVEMRHLKVAFLGDSAMGSSGVVVNRRQKRAYSQFTPPLKIRSQAATMNRIQLGPVSRNRQLSGCDFEMISKLIFVST